MEIGLLGFGLFVLIMVNVIGASMSTTDKDLGGTIYGISLIFVLLLSVVFGFKLAQEEPIKQYETKQEWKPRLQINNINNKQDTIYIYNLNDTNKIK